ncbi:MAG: LysR family transcriptional regulator [Porticoccaceae bacterium]|nr:LysR family transcriptional regulator [Porticoccaceae bacterium]
MKTAITLELFEILDAIDRRGSFAAAAEELGKVTSALSYAIQKHEALLEVSLFVRQGRRAVFTPAGRLLLEKGRELLTVTTQLADEAVTLARGWEPRIKIAMDALLAPDPVMQVLAQFLAENPSVEIDLCEEVLGGAWEALIQDRVQLAIGAPDPIPPWQGIRVEPMGNIDRVLAVSPDHPLTRENQPVSVEQISRYRMVIVHDSSRTSVPRANRLLNRDSHFYVQTFAHKISAQKAGIGVGFLPREVVAPLEAAGELVTLAVSGVHLQDALYLAWKTTNRGQGLHRLLQLLKARTLV